MLYIAINESDNSLLQVMLGHIVIYAFSGSMQSLV